MRTLKTSRRGQALRRVLAMAAATCGPVQRVSEGGHEHFATLSPLQTSARSERPRIRNQPTHTTTSTTTPLSRCRASPAPDAHFPSAVLSVWLFLGWTRANSTFNIIFSSPVLRFEPLCPRLPFAFAGLGLAETVLAPPQLPAGAPACPND